MKCVKAGLAYFALVFAAGFVLGAIRVPFLAPALGVRLAELLEMPVMFAVILIAARHVFARFALGPSARERLPVGMLALTLLLAAELLLALVVQDQPIGQYIASRDPVSNGVYVAMLLLFAAMPLLIGRPSAPASP